MVEVTDSSSVSTTEKPRRNARLFFYSLATNTKEKDLNLIQVLKHSPGASAVSAALARETN